MNIVLFLPEEINKPLFLHDERAIHIQKILHKKTGDFFTAGIINGKEGKAFITNIDSNALFFDFVAEKESSPPFPVTMIIGFPRPIQLKRLLRSLCSMGVAQICLTGTELGEKSYLKSSLTEQKNTLSALIDGIAQAKNTHLPELFYAASVEECIKKLSGTEFDQKILLDNVQQNIALSEAARTGAFQNKRIVAAIGSERGWTQHEKDIFIQSGFFCYGLGERILRTETAAVCALSLILTARGDI